MPNRTFMSKSFIVTGFAAATATFAAPSAGQVINEDLKLLASDGAVLDLFGTSVSIGGGIVAVGAEGHDVNMVNPDSGAVYLYDAETGIQLHKLLSTDIQSGHNLGRSVAVDTGMVAAGAPLGEGVVLGSGAAYVFSAASGAQLQKLIASDGTLFQKFGQSIDMNGGLVVVGAPDNSGSNLTPGPGSAYLFNAATGMQIHKLVANDAAILDSFGTSVAIADGLVVVGSPFDDDVGNATGSAYIFNAATGVQTAKLLPTADNQAGGGNFGVSVAIGGGIVAVGAELDNGIGPDAGTVYLFDAATGALIVEINPTTPMGLRQFGHAVAIDGGMIAVSAWREFAGAMTNSGAAYLFDAATGNQIAKLISSDIAGQDFFAGSIAIDGGDIVAGAPRDDDNGAQSGSAYIFRAPIDCVADVNMDGMLTPADFTAWIDAFNNNLPGCDQNGDGNCDPTDFTAWIANFNAGC